ncbi:hypothetical protein D779_2123 [Imhoffiella purpurea]|uniref:Uncharacterized protein n=1 Tax=Imhoffiella purpurea TaxID=1249627 RepID=W9VFV8_9GAMM|nr:hypothetical protein D779_2123 [Imhoffiella purpurea]
MLAAIKVQVVSPVTRLDQARQAYAIILSGLSRGSPIFKFLAFDACSSSFCMGPSPETVGSMTRILFWGLPSGQVGKPPMDGV